MQSNQTNSKLLELQKAKQAYNEKLDTIYSSFPNENKIGFPEFRILNSPAITVNISTCCVILLFNELDKEYFFGHYNSRIYRLSEGSHDLFDDLKLGISQIKHPKAIVIGGDTLFFTEIVSFLKDANIQIVASYLDDADENEINDAFTNKAVTFNPASKTAMVYSPILSSGKIELKDQQISLYNLQEDLLKGREATIQLYLQSEFRLPPTERKSTPPSGRRFSLSNTTHDSSQKTRQKTARSQEKSSSPSLRSLNLINSIQPIENPKKEANVNPSDKKNLSPNSSKKL